MRRVQEKAITAYYKSVIKDVVSEVLDVDLHKSKVTSDLTKSGLALVNKTVSVDKNYIQINFYLMCPPVKLNKNPDLNRDFNVRQDISDLLGCEAFYNTATNYLACKIVLAQEGDQFIPEYNASDITSIVLHELTHYLDTRVAKDYHIKNHPKPQNSWDMCEVQSGFDFLIYSLWTPTERNAFQTSNDEQWRQLKSNVDNILSDIQDLVDEVEEYDREYAEDDDEDKFYDCDAADDLKTLRDIFSKRIKPFRGSPLSFGKWWIKQSRSYFDQMALKRAKDNYLSKSLNEQIESLSNLLATNLMPFMKKSSAKFEVPFTFYSTKKRASVKERIRVSVVGFMDELESASVVLVNANRKLTQTDLRPLHKIYDSLYYNDARSLKSQCTILASQLIRIINDDT